jgi:hypothetical protein
MTRIITSTQPRFPPKYESNLSKDKLGESEPGVYTKIGPLAIREGRLQILQTIIHEEVHHWIHEQGFSQYNEDLAELLAGHYAGAILDGWDGMDPRDEKKASNPIRKFLDKLVRWIQGMKKSDSKLISEFLDKLVKGNIDLGESHVCPNCEGKLHVSIRVYTTTYWGRYLGVGAHCENCRARIVSQGKYIPPWAKESEYKDLNVEDLLKLIRGDSSRE